MKVGILTFPNSTSYGASLQMYALYHTVEEMGYEAEAINYFNAHMKGNLHLEKMQKLSPWKRMIRVRLTQLLHCRQHLGFWMFEKSMTKYPSRSFSAREQLPEIGERYGAVICGSDQVWNPDITNADLSYFLDFCGQKTARISYAPSFGVESLSESLSYAVTKELNRFSWLSVREESGRKLIRQIANRDAQLVVDPTLLMNAQQWTQYEISHPAVKGDYILYYTVRSSASLWQYCTNLAQRHNLKILRIGSNVISRNKKRNDMVEYVCDVSPGEWLYLVHHARCVVTNSFHGTAFSINYRKDFYVEFSSLTNSRLTHIINTLGLENQVVSSVEPSLSIKTDYTKTAQVLPLIREESRNYLEQALADAFERYEKA